MRLFESEIYDWWTMIRGIRICPLTRCVHFFECRQIRDFTALASFLFFRAWPAISAVFLEGSLYLPLSFWKQFYLTYMVDSEWNGAGEVLYYFSYQRAKFFTDNKITYTITKILRTCYRQFLAILPTLPQPTSRSSRGIRKNFYLYPSVNSCFFYFLLELRIFCQFIT